MDPLSAGAVPNDGPLPRVVSMGSSRTVDDGGFTLHTHLHDELCLVTDDATTITHGGRERAAPTGSLFLFRRGEHHGYRNARNQHCRLWVVHYQQDAASYAGMPWLDAADPERRTWRLTAAEQTGFRALFHKLQDEHYHPRTGSAAAESAWLRLLITYAGRLGQDTALPSPQPPDSELAEVRATLHRLLADPTPLEQAIPNYDSVRHRFKSAIGCSPRDYLAQLRLRTACNLLLETSKPLKAIATDVGYARSQEFVRAFTRVMGRPPGAWRREPG